MRRLWEEDLDAYHRRAGRRTAFTWRTRTVARAARPGVLVLIRVSSIEAEIEDWVECRSVRLLQELSGGSKTSNI